MASHLSGFRSTFSRPQYDNIIEQHLNQLGQHTRNVSVFYGPSGIGKTKLKKNWLKTYQKSYLCAELDGALYQSYRGLECDRLLFNQLTFQLYQQSVWFPTVDCVTRALQQKGLDFHIKPANAAPNLLGFTITLGLGVLNIVTPFVGLGMTAAWEALKERPELTSWFQKHSKSIADAINNCDDTEEMLSLLCQSWADDLDQHLDQEGAIIDRIIIFVDNVEKISDPAQGQSLIKALLKQHNPNVHWVLFTQRPIDEFFEDSDNVQQIKLEPLQAEESWSWLEQAGINDPDIQDYIISICQGNPLYLGMEIQRWHTLSLRWQDSSRCPNLEDFASAPWDALANCKHAWSETEQKVWQALACIDRWDAVLYSALMDRFTLDDWHEQFNDIITSPYVEGDEQHGWQLHDFLRKNLLQEIPQADQQAIFLWLCEYFQDQYGRDEQPVESLASVVKYGLMVPDPESVVTWVLKVIPDLLRQGQYSSLKPLLSQLCGGNISAEKRALSLSLLGQSNLALGEIKLAIGQLEEARAAWQAMAMSESAMAVRVELDLAVSYIKQNRIYDANDACLRARQVIDRSSLLFAELLSYEAAIANNRGQVQSAVKAVTQALALLETLGSPDLFLEAQLRYTAALWLANQNPTKARCHCERALESVLAKVSELHPLAIQGQWMLGSLDYLQGEHMYVNALDYLYPALNAAQSKLGPAHPQTLQFMDFVSRLLLKLGHVDHAEVLQQEYQQNKQTGGRVSKGMADQLHRVGLALTEKGSYGEAEPYLIQALQINKHILGDEHCDVATNLNNLAGLYSDQGRYEEAEPPYRQALKMRKKLLGSEHLDVANSLNNLALLYSNQGRYEEAESLYRQALEMCQKLLGTEHLFVALCLNNLAALYDNLGRYKEAESLYRQALEMREKLLGAEHPNVATSLNNLATLYDNQGRYKEAEPLCQQALAIKQKHLGIEHPDLAINLNTLAALYTTQGRYEEAESLYRQALGIKQKHLGTEHPSIATSLNNLAAFYSDQDRYGEAESLYRQALEMNEKLLGTEHPSVATSLNNLAALYRTQGRYTEAGPLYRRALQITQTTLSLNHPHTRTIQKALDQIQ